MKNLLFAPLSLGLFVSACNSGEPTATADVEVTSPEVVAVTVTPKTPGSDFPSATIRDWAYENGTFTYDYDSTTYKLGQQSPDANTTMCANSAKGQHVHLIVDDEPYIAKYTSTFEQDIEDGEHYMLTFLSRSYHESIKTDAAHRAELVTVADGAFGMNAPITDPMLFYSRPKGTYTGKDADNLLLDFYPVNLELGDDYMVKVETGGETFILDEWQPYVIKGLPMGENTVTLTLIDGEGARVDAPLNPVTRTFTLAADPLTEG